MRCLYVWHALIVCAVCPAWVRYNLGTGNIITYVCPCATLETICMKALHTLILINALLVDFFSTIGADNALFILELSGRTES